MSFDHDAAGERGVERQKCIDGLYDHLYWVAEQLDEDAVDAFLAEFHVLLLTYLMSGSAKPALFPGKYRNEIFDALDHVRSRAAEFGLDMKEYRYILLVLSQKVLASATSKVVNTFCMWEMEKFQERASA